MFTSSSIFISIEEMDWLIDIFNIRFTCLKLIRLIEVPRGQRIEFLIVLDLFSSDPTVVKFRPQCMEASLQIKGNLCHL